MYRQVSRMVEQRHLKLLGEQSFGQTFPFLRQRGSLEFVACGRYDFKLELPLRKTVSALVQDCVGLG
jgi:hypothetical protein